MTLVRTTCLGVVIIGRQRNGKRTATRDVTASIETATLVRRKDGGLNVTIDETQRREVETANHGVMKEIARTVIAARNTNGVATEVGNENEQITTSGDTTTTAQTDRRTPIPPRDLAPGHAEIQSHTQVETNLQERRAVDIEVEIGELLLPFSVYVIYFKHFGW